MFITFDVALYCLAVHCCCICRFKARMLKMEIGECNKKAKNNRKSSLPFICLKLSKVILVQETINCKTGLRTFFLVK